MYKAICYDNDGEQIWILTGEDKAEITAKCQEYAEQSKKVYNFQVLSRSKEVHGRTREELWVTVIRKDDGRVQLVI